VEKVVRKWWFMLALPGLVFLAAFLIGGGVEGVSGRLPIAYAASHQVADASIPSVAYSPCRAYKWPIFRSTVVVNSGEVICSDMTSFGGTVVIHGEVRGDVVAFGGTVVIDGPVFGNVLTYGSNVIWQDDAHVDGDIHVCGSQLIPRMNSQLHGSYIGCTQRVGMLIIGDGSPGLHLWSLLAWLALGILLTSLLPEHVMLVRTTAKSKIRRSLLLGLLSVLLAPAVLAVLVALLVSIPLAILVAVGLVAAWVLGMVAVGWLIGDYLVRTVLPQQNTRVMQIVVGLTVLVLAGSLPYIGWLISIGAGLLGLGAVLLSRFGTRLYCQPKQPLPL